MSPQGHEGLALTTGICRWSLEQLSATIARPMFRLAMVAAVVAGGVACTSVAGTSGSTARDYGLVPAQHAQCGVQGSALAHYLDTGEPTSNDPTYGSDRAQALSMSGEQRALYIRRTADEYIARCDSAETEREAAATQAARDAALATKFAAACRSRGGVPRSTAIGVMLCGVTYPDPSGGSRSYEMPLKPDGTLNEAQAEAERQICALDMQQYDKSGTPGWGSRWAKAPTFHPDTGVCDRAHP